MALPCPKHLPGRDLTPVAAQMLAWRRPTGSALVFPVIRQPSPLALQVSGVEADPALAANLCIMEQAVAGSCQGGEGVQSSGTGTGMWAAARQLVAPVAGACSPNGGQREPGPPGWGQRGRGRISPAPAVPGKNEASAVAVSAARAREHAFCVVCLLANCQLHGPTSRWHTKPATFWSGSFASCLSPRKEKKTFSAWVSSP